MTKRFVTSKSGNRLSSSGNPATTIGIRPQTHGQLFSCEFCEITKNTFSYRTPQAAAYAHNKKGKVLNRSTEKPYFFQRHMTKMSGICPSMLDGEILPSHFEI